MRNEAWLEGRLNNIWRAFFNDIPRANIAIRWGRRARTRLGSITRQRFGKSFWSNIPIADEGTPTIITINSLFKDEAIPAFVVDMTIAHEVCHYAHGFNSPLPQKYAKPHEGGVIGHEFRERGLEEAMRLQKKWLKENWTEYVKTNLPRRQLRRRKFWI